MCGPQLTALFSGLCIVLSFYLSTVPVNAEAIDPAQLVKSDQWRCAPSEASRNYISVQDLDRLRDMSSDATSSPAAFSRLSDANHAIVAEALRIGPVGAFSSARLLRDLIIIEALDQQARCEPGQCDKPRVISEFQASPTAERAWSALRDLWIKFRDDDASAARPCLAIWKALPAAPGIVAAEAQADRPADSTAAHAAPAPGRSTDADIVPQFAGLDPAEIRFCRVRSPDAQDKSEVSDDQVRQLREDFRKGDLPALAGMNVKYREPLEEMLRVGPGAGYYAHRTLRNLVIIKEVDRQNNCPVQQTCSLSDDIRSLKRNKSGRTRWLSGSPFVTPIFSEPWRA